MLFTSSAVKAQSRLWTLITLLCQDKVGQSPQTPTPQESVRSSGPGSWTSVLDDRGGIWGSCLGSP